MKYSLFCCLIFLTAFNLNATVFQILHTNDSHSFLDSATNNSSVGGVARLKSLIDFYKNKMKNQGISTLTLDAGDFSEGNLYFMANYARKSFIAHSTMGYDVVTMGNHEYLMGAKDLNTILGELDLNFSFLAANLIFNTDCENVQHKITPFKEFTIDGIKFAILGLTTNEMSYKWRFGCGKITDPIQSALFYENKLRKRNNDIVIGLTHLGVNTDLKLAAKTKELDLIIGGHSHTTLFKPLFIKNLKGKSVPIVQAGYHTQYLGRLLIEVSKGNPLRILNYELIPVNNEIKDEQMNRLVEEANQDLDQLYGAGWLEKTIGYSDMQATDPMGEEKWAYFITDTIKEKINAEIGIHFPSMNGEAFPVGKISRKSLLNSIPRVFNINNKFGWAIYTTNIKGVWLQLSLESMALLGRPIILSGITLKYNRGPFGIKTRQLLVNGKKINPFKNYRVALTEGVALGVAGVSHFASALIGFPQKTPSLIWATLEEKIITVGPGLKLDQLSRDGHTYIPSFK
jgi:2',3'-cyclic-nucleotide 2'-phosphodiesterase (5'-nucleotidase family)